MVGDGEGYAARGGDYGLNAKDNAGRVGTAAVVPVRGAAGLFRLDQARRSAFGWNDES